MREPIALTRRMLREQNSLRVVYVCTANRCRSPFAEHILRAAAGSLPLVASSRGLFADGSAVPKRGLRVAEERGLTGLASHRSRQVDAAEILRADLILTMERAHARELVGEHPDLAARIFTLKQFDRWSLQHPAPASPVSAWLDAFGCQPAAELLGSSPEDDTVDPIISGAHVWRAMADDFEQHADGLVRWLFAGRPRAIERIRRVETRRAGYQHSQPL